MDIDDMRRAIHGDSAFDMFCSIAAKFIILGICAYLCWGIPSPYRAPSIALLWIVWTRSTR